MSLVKKFTSVQKVLKACLLFQEILILTLPCTKQETGQLRNAEDTTFLSAK